VQYFPPYWDDLRVAANAQTPGGGNDPEFKQIIDNGAGSSGVFAWRFKTTDQRELFFWAQLPHTWQEGGIIKPHVHWCPEDATAGTVDWGLEYTVAKVNGTFPNSAIIGVTTNAGGVAFRHQVAAMPDINLTGDTISTMLGCRIFRNGTTDTYGNFADLLEVDFHFELDQPGSRQETVK